MEEVVNLLGMGAGVLGMQATAVGKGFWKASQARKGVPKKHNLVKQTCESSFQLAKEGKGDTKIGTITSLVYYEGLKSSSGKKTYWLMSEYRFPEKLDPQPLFNESDHELTLCVIYYNGKKKGNDGQLAMLPESDPIPPQIPMNQNFDHSPYTFPILNNPNYNYHHNTSPQEYLYSCSSFDSNCAPFRQYKPLINRVAVSSGEEWSVEQNYADFATTSTMHPSFPQLPYRRMENLDIFPSIPQNIDIHEFDPSMSYFNVDDFDFMGDEEISHIPNSNVDSVDQNKLDTYVAKTSQDDQSSQHHQQL
ncbi:hypothetical protein RND71_036338 [Anisodus tanguticus]|uniref:NAC domain-containing protein n=1 Tax=Anisodus tanguticus TaxID=243964 RepID=A0AAE1R097_9SOLA|nr:hypothetical protein RND71_036338 [Anisodus tanguticus]